MHTRSTILSDFYEVDTRSTIFWSNHKADAEVMITSKLIQHLIMGVIYELETQVYVEICNFGSVDLVITSGFLPFYCVDRSVHILFFSILASALWLLQSSTLWLPQPRRLSKIPPAQQPFLCRPQSFIPNYTLNVWPIWKNCPKFFIETHHILIEPLRDGGELIRCFHRKNR